MTKEARRPAEPNNDSQDRNDAVPTPNHRSRTRPSVPIPTPPLSLPALRLPALRFRKRRPPHCSRKLRLILDAPYSTAITTLVLLPLAVVVVTACSAVSGASRNEKVAVVDRGRCELEFLPETLGASKPRCTVGLDARIPDIGQCQGWDAVPALANAITHTVIHSCEGGYEGCVNTIRYQGVRWEGPDVGAHFIVSEDGLEVTQTTPTPCVSYHAADFNLESIGIEVAGYANRTEWPDQVYSTVAQILGYVCNKYSIDCRPEQILKTTGETNNTATVVSHAWVAYFRGYFGQRSDPGWKFQWATLAAKVKQRLDLLADTYQPRPPTLVARAARSNLLTPLRHLIPLNDAGPSDRRAAIFGHEATLDHGGSATFVRQDLRNYGCSADATPAQCCREAARLARMEESDLQLCQFAGGSDRGAADRGAADGGMAPFSSEAALARVVDCSAYEIRDCDGERTGRSLCTYGFRDRALPASSALLPAPAAHCARAAVQDAARSLVP